MMWAYGHNVRVENVNCGKQTCDYGVCVSFDPTSCTNSRETNRIKCQLDYVGTIQEKSELDYKSFRCVVFKCNWFDIFDKTRCFRHDLVSKVYSINIHREMSTSQSKPYVLLEHCQQILFHLDVFSKMGGLLLLETQGKKRF
jgi:hypothetical protein